VKNLFVVSSAKEKAVPPETEKDAVLERRRNQRRMGIARRVVANRRSKASALPRTGGAQRRASGNRRRLQDRRIGLSKNLDLYLLGI